MLAAIPYVCQPNTECLIVGDFNAPHIDWETLSCPSSEVFDAQFLDTLDDCLLCQHVDFKTRFRWSQRASVLDLILTSYPNSVSNVEPLSPLGKSDHLLILIDV